MNCPSCGLPSLEDQKFCRSCGAGLQMTTRPLEAPATNREVTPTIGLRAGGNRGSGWMLWSFALMFLGVAIGVIGKMMLHQELVTGVGVLVSVAGMFLTVYPFVLPSSREKYEPNPSAASKGLASPQPAKSLPQERSIEYVPGITERTTELLDTPIITSSGQKKDGELRG